MPPSGQSHPPGLSGNDTRCYFLSLLYPVAGDTDETRDVYVFFDDDGGKITLERYPYHQLDEVYRKQIKATRKKRSIAFFCALALLAVALVVSMRYFQILLFISLAATLYEFMDRRIRYLWLRREYEHARRSTARRSGAPGTRKERADI